jgi:hypothetical protein
VLADVEPLLRAFLRAPGEQPELSDAGTRWRLLRAAATGRV